MDELTAAYEEFAKGITPVETPPPEAEQQPEQKAEQQEAAAETAEPEKAEATEEAEEPARDEKGRFIKVAVHAREMASVKALVSERESRIAELERQLTEVQGKSSKPHTLESLSALREKLKDEAPEFVSEIIDALEGELVTRDEKLKAYEAREQQMAAREAAEAQAERARVLSAVPVLTEWETAAQAEDSSPEAKALWSRAVLHEKTLRESGLDKWADHGARFRQAAIRAAEDVGVELKPEQIGVKKSVAPPPVPKTPAARTAPTSLTQIGGRSPPDPGKGISNSFHENLAMTRGMSDSDVEKFFFGAR